MRISRKGWQLLLATLLFAFCCLAALYCRFTASKSEVKQAMARVITRVHYELRADGKTVLTFGRDSLESSACWADRWELLPGSEGLLAVALNDSLERARYAALPAHEFLANAIDSVQHSLDQAEWNMREFEYWSRSHHVQDEGYEMAIR